MKADNTIKLTSIRSSNTQFSQCQTFQSTEIKGSSKDNGKYSSSVDTQVAKYDEERQEYTISNPTPKPYSTPVDAVDYLTKPNKEINQKNAGFTEADTVTAKANNSELFIISGDEDENHNATNGGHQHQHPIQPATDTLCTGMRQSKVMASPPHPSMVTVLWVHPQSPLVSISVSLEE